MSDFAINFIIPVRHYRSVQDWQSVKTNLEHTLKSIFGQTNDNWHCYIICNRGTDLPKSANHENVTVLESDFEFISLPNKSVDPEAYHDLIRKDKGARVYEALKYCKANDFFMVVDYGDFVHRELVEFINDRIKKNAGEYFYGWLIDVGYVYSGGNVALLNKAFDTICGTSNIVRVSFFEKFYDEYGNLPLLYIKELLGSHRYIKNYMSKAGYSYGSLPFPGAVYNVGISNSSSQTGSVVKEIFSFRKFLKMPRTMIKLWLSIRLFTTKSKRMFNIHC